MCRAMRTDQESRVRVGRIGGRRMVRSFATLAAVTALLASVIAAPATAGPAPLPSPLPKAAPGDFLGAIAPGIEVDAVVIAPEAALQTRGLGGTITAPVTRTRGTAAELRAALAATPGAIIRRGHTPIELATTEGLPVIGANPWHSTGFTGAGTRIAVVDTGYDGYAALLGSELPANPTTKSFRPDEDLTPGTNHGTAVAEIVHDVAPDAHLYLINVASDLDVPDVVDYLIDQKIDVVNMSLGWTVGPLDGTSDLAMEIQRAIDAGIIWINAAGNEAKSHWGGSFIDVDTDQWGEFSGSQENNSFQVDALGVFSVDLSWTGTGDVDLYLNDDLDNVIATSNAPQDPGDRKIETITWVNQTFVTQTYSFSIYRYSGSPGRVDAFISSSSTNGLVYQDATSSINVPGDVTDVLTVGAVAYYDTDTIEDYSSRGPTVDGRTKPDLVSPTRVSTSTYGAGSFAGTSAASPHVAGLAALHREANQLITPSGFRSLITGLADPLPGPPGPTNDWGFGLIAGGAAPEARRPSCDFNGDDYADLAFGSPGEDIGLLTDAGLVNVLHGMAGELDTGATTNQAWHQDVAGVDGVAEVGDRFGETVACGDFDGDGYGDLAIGAPGEGVDGSAGAGAFHIIYGSGSGLSSQNDMYTHNSTGIKGIAGAGNGLGSALAVGDFDADGYDDLAVGTPGMSVGGDAGAGAVSILFGATDGLSDRDQLFSQATGDLAGAAEPGDAFGTSLAAGDFDGDGYDDLAIGSPLEALGELSNAGLVHVVFGNGGGLATTGSESLHQNTAGVVGITEAGDRFGGALAAGDFDHDGYADLAIGVAKENIGALVDAGAVTVVYGDSSGMSGTSDGWHQNSAGIKGLAEPGDLFGASLTTGDFDYDGRDDLAIGVPGEDIGSKDSAGLVAVLFGAGSGVSARDLVKSQNSAGVSGSAEEGDRFGGSLHAIDLNGDRYLDIVVGTSGESVGAIEGAGALIVLYGDGLFPLFVDPGLISQSSAGVIGAAEAGDQTGSVGHQPA